jgi:hypothetical protein
MSGEVFRATEYAELSRTFAEACQTQDAKDGRHCGAIMTDSFSEDDPNAGYENLSAGWERACRDADKRWRDAKPNGFKSAVETTDGLLAEMNTDYAVVKVGGKTRVMSLEESPMFGGCKVPVFSTIQDFCAFNLKKKVSVQVGKDIRVIGVGKWWIEHAERRQYDGVVYDPSGTGGSMFNLWSGFSCKPRAGNCDLYLAHLRDNICGGNAGHYEYLLSWMAYAVQNPGKPGEVAVMMRGKEGVGKGVAAKEFGYLFGAHFRHVVHAKHLTGHFNAHLQQCSVLFADEAFFAGDRSHESTLKALITEGTLMIEPKGVDPFPVRNCIHLIMSSNADWVVPAGAEARRYFVLNVADTHIQDSDYFEAIVRQMETGGREALVDLLGDRDLSDFNIRGVPQTEALAEQKQHSRRGIDRLIENIAHGGVLPSAHSIQHNIAITTGEERGEGFYPAARAIAPDLKHVAFQVIADTLSKQWGCKRWHSGSTRGIQFPSLAELRALFDRRHGAQDWPPDIVDWEAT